MEQNTDQPLLIAHRGWHQAVFENTIEAFEMAASMPDFWGIETDIHLSRDGEWVIHHDETFLSGGQMYVIKDLMADELYRLPLDNDKNLLNARICPLESYLKICYNSQKHPIIEIKPKKVSDEKLAELVNLVNRYMGIDSATFIAFYPSPLFALRRLYGKKIHLQHLVGKSHRKLVLFLAKRVKADLDSDYKLLTEKQVKAFHRRGLQTNVWTVNHHDAYSKAVSLGVDYVTTDTLTREIICSFNTKNS